MYNESFIKRIEKVYGENSKITELARNGAEFLGRYLDDNQVTFSYNDILNNSYEKLCKMANNAKERSELYSDWISGKASTQDGLRERYCPINYLQNSNANNRYEMKKQICKEVGYVGYYPGCKMWECKGECWKKYDELNK